MADNLYPDLDLPDEGGDPTAPVGQVWTRLVRTITPYLTVWLVAKLAEWGIEADATEVTGAVVVVFGSVWYALVTTVEQRWPKFGWLLGRAKTPEYK